jgi:hypothetical protein
VSLRIIGFAALLICAGPSWACGPDPTPPVPSLERLPGESEATYSARVNDFATAQFKQRGEEARAAAANAQVQQGRDEARRQEVQWDTTANILLSHVESVERQNELGEYRVTFRTERAVKGHNSSPTTYRIGSISRPLACTDMLTSTPDADLGTAILIFMADQQLENVSEWQLIPLSELRSERLWAIINGTAPTP